MPMNKTKHQNMNSISSAFQLSLLQVRDDLENRNDARLQQHEPNDAGLAVDRLDMRVEPDEVFPSMML
jgi:hypothetical protein